MKYKSCDACKKQGEVMYRIQKEKGKAWIFVCPECLPAMQKLDDYRYGGTWKGYRH